MSTMSFSDEDSADLADREPSWGHRTSSTVSTTASYATVSVSESEEEAHIEDSWCWWRRMFCLREQLPPHDLPPSRHCLAGASLESSPGCGRRESIVSLGAPPSDAEYAEPAQTILCLDWDDTLFPSTEVFERWGVCKLSDTPPPLEREDALQAWRDALFDFLMEATCLSDRCVIITNSKKTWVENCIRRFAPNIAKFLEEGPDGKRRLKVVYSVERLSRCKKMRSKQTDLRPVMRHREKTFAELEDEQTRAKYTAMRQEVAEFYSQYKGQSWKNVVSVGDMRYEHDAVTELGFRRIPRKPEKLRTKAILVPTGPGISEITLRLRVARLLLPAFVQYDGDLDLDLGSAADPLGAIAEALRLPHLEDVPLSQHAWGRAPPPEDLAKVEEALGDIAVIVHNTVFI